MMKKIIICTCFFCVFCNVTGLVAAPAVSDYIEPNTYNNMYPYMNNSMRTALNTGQSPSGTNAQINVLTRTSNLPNTTQRRVTSRSTGRTNTTTSARSASNNSIVSQTNSSNVSSARSVVARPNVGRSAVFGTGTGTIARRGGTVVENIDNSARLTRVASTAESENNTMISSARCLADYTECMNGYCQREDTKYNRCYCSAKLAQIDSEYQPAIDALIKQILTMQTTTYWTDEEMNEYWMEKVGQYSGGNSWENLENALNINWADTESRVRGQQAFATGHEYCVQHLRGCYYMASNLRDAYRSQIARDCNAYQASLQTLKSIAESVVESYKE